MARHFVLLFIVFSSQFVFSKTIRLIKRNDYKVAISQYEDFQLVGFSGSFRPKHGFVSFQHIMNHIERDKPIVFWVKSGRGGLGSAHRRFMRNMLDKSGRVEAYLLGLCASACTIWAAMASQSTLVGNLWTLGVHTTWVIKSSLKVFSPEQMAARYGRWGANQDWFQNNLHVFSDAYQARTYRMSEEESLASGLADQVIERDEFIGMIGKEVYQTMNRALL